MGVVSEALFSVLPFSLAGVLPWYFGHIHLFMFMVVIIFIIFLVMFKSYRSSLSTFRSWSPILVIIIWSSWFGQVNNPLKNNFLKYENTFFKNMMHSYYSNTYFQNKTGQRANTLSLALIQGLDCLNPESRPWLLVLNKSLSTFSYIIQVDIVSHLRICTQKVKTRVEGCFKVNL